MRIDPKARAAIRAIIADKPHITMDEVMGIVAEYAGAPDIGALVRQEHRRTARYYLSRVRDGSGVRDIYSTDDERGNTTYINVSTSEDLEALAAAQRQVERKREGNDRASRKINHRITVVASQISLFEPQEKNRQF